MKFEKYHKPLAVLQYDRQSSMKNLEVKFSLSELEFRCKNLFLIYGESIGEQEFDGRIFHM